MFSLTNLNHQKEIFYKFLEQLSDAVICVNKNFQIQYSNAAAGKLLDQQSFKFVVDLCERKQQQIMQDESWTETLDYDLGKAKHLFLDMHVTVVRNDDASASGFIITCKEIFRPRASQDYDFQLYYEALMKHLPALAWIMDEQFKCLYFNEEFRRVLKVSDDKINCFFEKLFPPEINTEFKRSNDLVISGNALLETIEEGKDEKGAKCIYKVYRFPVNSGNGKMLLGGIALNITDQVKQQQELSAFNERFLYINKATSDAIWDWDIVGDQINRGEGYAKLSGNNNCGLPMVQHLQFIHIKDRKRVFKSLETALDSNKVYWEVEYRFLCKDGTYHDIIDKGYIVRNQAGKPVRMIGAMEDVSQNRRLEKVLIEKEEAKKKEIIKAIIEAQEKERTQISYELHEHLSQNLATCKLLLDGLHFPEIKEEERIRLRSTNKLLTQTMNEIRSMSHQLNANAIKMVGLLGVMRDVTSTVNQNWQVEVLLQCNGFSDATVLPKDIEVSAFRIFQEGMNNVLRHSGATHATVQIAKKNKWLVLSIKDNGKGFDVDSTPKGLGFTNIINRVDYHNGTVSINSSEGNGCTLEVKLPIAETNHE